VRPPGPVIVKDYPASFVAIDERIQSSGFLQVVKVSVSAKNPKLYTRHVAITVFTENAGGEYHELPGNMTS
jgi:hypothetical protein